jgi:hypothetical protein
MLFTGIIILTYYLSKAYNQPINYPKQIKQEEKAPTLDEAYNMKPTEIFKTMFINPSVFQGYQEVKL